MSQGQRVLGRRAFARQLVVACGAGVALACGEASQAGNTAPAEPVAQSAAAPAQPIVVINHVTPRRDFVGPQPDRFEWTAATGADTYAIGIWNDSDRLIWRKDDVPTNSVDRPQELVLDPGTFFWQVTALQQGRAIARSGQGAFVVE